MFDDFGNDALGSLTGFGGGPANKDLYGMGPTQSANIGAGFNDYRVAGSTNLAMTRGQSVPATSYGYAKSNYTASEFDSENETHS